VPNLRVALFEKVVEEMKKVGGRKSVKEDTLILCVVSQTCALRKMRKSLSED